MTKIKKLTSTENLERVKVNQHILYFNVKKDTTLSKYIIFIMHIGVFINCMTENKNTNGNGYHEEKKLVYLFLYNPMIYTTNWTTQSVHEKRKSAIEAMEKHREILKQKWIEDFPTKEEQQEHTFGKFEDWRVTAMVLNP